MKSGLEDFARAAATPEKTDEAALLTQEDGLGGPTRGSNAGVIGGHLPWTSAGEANAIGFLEQMRADMVTDRNKYMDNLATRTRAVFARVEADAARREQERAATFAARLEDQSAVFDRRLADHTRKLQE